MLLTVVAAMTMFFTTICSWMASSGDAPAMMSPVMAPGSAISPTVLALSITGDNAITSDLFTCCNVASRGVAPRARAAAKVGRRIQSAFFWVKMKWRTKPTMVRKPRATGTSISRSSPRRCTKLSATAMATTAVAATGFSMPTRKSRQNPGAPRSAGRGTCSSNADACSISVVSYRPTAVEGSDQTCAADRRQFLSQRR
uniref:Secreted protein n=1 Tax=Setaria viridis TaxID=4556 RepID=A0A4U6V7Q4_SETVI|nr:hypothetical protein SEVIR_3G044000v2 [Setaria viridis]